MTYLYPDSDLVGDATIRLANYYYKQEKRYDVAARIYENFQRRFPQHNKAARALFMSGACFVKQGEYVQEEWDADPDHVNSIGKMQPQSREMFKKAVDTFASLNDQYHDTTSPAMRAQALYWAGDASFRIADYKNAYIYLKRVTFEYPETEWARRARGLLLQESEAFGKMEQQEAEAQQ